jgi:hypothetical protein
MQYLVVVTKYAEVVISIGHGDTILVAQMRLVKIGTVWYMAIAGTTNVACLHAQRIAQYPFVT